MSGSIKLSPEELTAQAAQMSALASQYEALFKGVNSTMKNVNGNWSTNLAHNFSGKINAAQIGFSNVVLMLNQGASAAGNSAKTMEGIDRSLAKVMNGEGGVKASPTKDSSQKKTTKKEKKEEISGSSEDFFHPSKVSKEKWEERKENYWDTMEAYAGMGDDFLKNHDIPILSHLKTAVENTKKMADNEGAIGELHYYSKEYYKKARECSVKGDHINGAINTIKAVSLSYLTYGYYLMDYISGGITTASSEFTEAVIDKNGGKIVTKGMTVVSKIASLAIEILPK